jgi:hypothetical protein
MKQKIEYTKTELKEAYRKGGNTFSGGARILGIDRKTFTKLFVKQSCDKIDNHQKDPKNIKKLVEKTKEEITKKEEPKVEKEEDTMVETNECVCGLKRTIGFEDPKVQAIAQEHINKKESIKMYPTIIEIVDQIDREKDQILQLQKSVERKEQFLRNIKF